jgi:hypothetical protein
MANSPAALSQPFVRLLVVIPLGPRDDARPVLESLLAYADPSRKIIVIDDTGRAEPAQEIAAIDSSITVLRAEGSPGYGGHLWHKFCGGLRHAFENYRFEVLLRLDADALVIARGAEDEARAYFEKHPGVGILGSHKFDCNGFARDFSAAASKLKRETGWRGWLRHPALRRLLREACAQAEKNGYQPGENCLGGAWFLRHAAVEALYRRGWLNRPEIVPSRIHDDELLGLFCYACGFGLADFATGDRPLGLKWRGLPDTPLNLLRRGKKIIHSTKSWAEFKEEETRAFFAARRRADLESQPARRGGAASGSMSQ